MKTEKHTSKRHLGKDVITIDTGNYFEMNDNEIMVHKRTCLIQQQPWLRFQNNGIQLKRVKTCNQWYNHLSQELEQEQHIEQDRQ